MSEAKTKLPVRPEESMAHQVWRPIEGLRREVERLFEDFDRDFWHSSFRRPGLDIEPLSHRAASWGAAPAVDIVEKPNAYEITAELPGIDEKNIELKLSNGGLTTRGEKQEEKEEKKKDYYLHERHFGSFERYFGLPEGVDPDKIEARFNKGVLTVTLPKKPEAQKPEKRIEIKSA